MNQSKAIEQYASEIPKEVRDVINGLSENVRMAIIVTLLKNDKTTFTELKNLLDLKSSSLSYHLSLMQDGGLVDNILDLKESHSYYKATDIARDVLESLSKIVVGSSTPAFDWRVVTDPPHVQNTSGVIHDFYNTLLANFIKSDDLNISTEQQYHSNEDYRGNRSQAERSLSDIIQPLQTAATNSQSFRRKQNQEGPY